MVIILFAIPLVCFMVGIIVDRFEKKGWVETHMPFGIYEKYIKRPLDFTLALMTLILFWPLILILTIVVRINMGSPVVFFQERPGLGGEVFKIRKFRTMTNEKDAEGELLPDDKRLTKFGKLLRTSSLDEVYEIINIIRGDLAIVGPRPLLVRYLPRYNEKQRHRHDVRPGLTGLAQVHGRNEISWVKKLDMDVQYVDRITFLGDLKIFIQTIVVVLKHDGISIDCPEFTGENEK